MTRRPVKRDIKKKPAFVDVFAGCGGLSLGLLNAGWIGRFAVEKNPDAFNTLALNLLRGERHSFEWPTWLPEAPCSTASLLKKHRANLRRLKGRIDLLAGAPPCQGFSLAGRRLHSDPRNSLFEQYLDIVKQLQPRLVLVENVQGFSLPFKSELGEANKTYSEILVERLRRIGYTVFTELVNFSEFGVPQSRNRFVLVGVRNGDRALSRLRGKTPFQVLREYSDTFLRSKRLPTRSAISARQAILDLEVRDKPLVACQEPGSTEFMQLDYASASRRTSRFVQLMRKDVEGPPDSIRLPRHRSTTVQKFKQVMATCQRGRSLRDADRKRLGIKKQALTPLDPKRPASTVTTLPDDLIHYSEPRILTVRENARLQTFPDWFQFTGNYTTGGLNRGDACPRYTQVGNAVPPIFSEAIGLVLKRLAS